MWIEKVENSHRGRDGNQDIRLSGSRSSGSRSSGSPLRRAQRDEQESTKITAGPAGLKLTIHDSQTTNNQYLSSSEAKESIIIDYNVLDGGEDSGYRVVG